MQSKPFPTIPSTLSHSIAQISSLSWFTLSPHFPSVNMCKDTRAQFSAIHAQTLVGRCSQIVTILLVYDIASNCTAILVLAIEWLVAPPTSVVCVLAWVQRSSSVKTRRSKRYSTCWVCVCTRVMYIGCIFKLMKGEEQNHYARQS